MLFKFSVTLWLFKQFFPCWLSDFDVFANSLVILVLDKSDDCYRKQSLMMIPLERLFLDMRTNESSGFCFS